jgi:hypothetical protein
MLCLMRDQILVASLLSLRLLRKLITKSLIFNASDSQHLLHGHQLHSQGRSFAV